MTTADDANATDSLASVLAGRADSYRMFSRMFLKPLSEADIEEFAAIDYGSIAEALSDTPLLAEGFKDMGSVLRKRHSGTRQQLSTDFTMCFDGITAIDEQVAVPYASVFLGESALLYQEPRQKVYELFQAESISLKTDVKLPEDHLSFELEFLAVLSDRIATALEHNNQDEALRNLELSREFINEHILSWLDLLRERAEKILKTRFYRGALKATRGYLELDLKTIEDLIEVVRNGQN
ncbi:MAG: molecular chaperone TorD family protein [Coriobacteriales bacterium]|jgi:TorA maturation chaperone TorD|nr:molecular chaperone TorD family protein [Coriobacteriales bacterium]